MTAEEILVRLLDDVEAIFDSDEAHQNTMKHSPMLRMILDDIEDARSDYERLRLGMTT